MRSPCTGHRISFCSSISNFLVHPSPVKRIQALQSQLISDDEWNVIADSEYATNHEQAMDAHEIVDEIYRHAENFMHESGTVMQPDYVGKPEDLYLWCLIGE